MRRNKISISRNDYEVQKTSTDFPLVEDMGIEPRPMPEPAGDKFPVPGISKYTNKMSGTQDFMIGPRRSVGHVNDNANETSNWSREDAASSGLIARQPL